MQSMSQSKEESQTLAHRTVNNAHLSCIYTKLWPQRIDNKIRFIIPVITCTDTQTIVQSTVYILSDLVIVPSPRFLKYFNAYTGEIFMKTLHTKNVPQIPKGKEQKDIQIVTYIHKFTHESWISEWQVHIHPVWTEERNREREQERERKRASERNMSEHTIDHGDWTQRNRKRVREAERRQSIFTSVYVIM